MSQTLLQVKNISVSYGAVQALFDLSFSVNEGEIFTLIGSNGAGKSTILRTISGLIRGTKGNIFYEGRDISKDPAEKIVRAGINHCPEGRGIFSNMSVEENLKLGADWRKDKTEYEKDREEAFLLFPRLKERLWQNAGTLSGGEQQMLAIARALMSHPKVLLLDEPSLGLAPQVIEKIFETIVAVNKKGTTVILVEQNALLALEIASKAIVLETGRIMMEGAARDLLSSQEVRKAYLGEA